MLSDRLYQEVKKQGCKVRKREALVKVKLVLVNIKFKLDINMPVIVTNPSIGFRV